MSVYLVLTHKADIYDRFIAVICVTRVAGNADPVHKSLDFLYRCQRVLYVPYCWASDRIGFGVCISWKGSYCVKKSINQAPLPQLPWNEERQAVEDGSYCTQRDPYRRDYAVSGSEDCLYLHVYAPLVSIYIYTIEFWTN